MNKNMHPFPCLPTISAAILSALFAAVSTAVFADDAATRGAKPGQWTQDYTAKAFLDDLSKILEQGGGQSRRRAAF